MTDIRPTTSAPAEPDQIEVGAADGTLRYWLAKEALRQAEARLADQNDALNGHRTRATSLLGWSVTLAAALAAAVATGSAPNTSLATTATIKPWFVPGVAAGVCFILCSITCVATLWPRRWEFAGGYTKWLLGMPFATELETIESMANGVEESIQVNAQNLATLSRRVKVAWVLFAAAPVVGMLAIAVQSIIP